MCERANTDLPALAAGAFVQFPSLWVGNQGLTGFSEAGEKSVKTCNCFIVFSMKKKCLCVMDAEVTAQAVVLETWGWVHGFPMQSSRTKFTAECLQGGRS